MLTEPIGAVHDEGMPNRPFFIFCVFALTVIRPSESAPLISAAAESRLMSKHLVAISDGRQMNVVCIGHGSPTVVFEQGAGANILSWQKVAEPVAKFTRACFYDRAGYGYSEPPGRPSTAEHAAQDLHNLLVRSGIRRPVVLVGHSLGGLYATYFADKYPGEVVGIVLVEPSFAEQDKDLDAATRAKDEAAFKENISQLRRCSALARSGKLAQEMHEECFAFATNRTAKERAFLTYQYVRPDRYEALASEVESQHSADGRSDINSRHEVAARRSFGRIPIIVMTAAESIDGKATTAERNASSNLWRSWKAGHDMLAARSGLGRSIVISQSGHFVQLDQPQEVIEAVKEVVRETRQRQSAHR